MLVASAVFYLFASFSVLSAFMVIASKNPVHSVLFLILAFFSSSGLFLLLGAEFIAMLMIIVYVGAVAVLFLFVVMMLNIDFAKLRGGFVKNLPVAIGVAVVMFAEIFAVLNYTGGDYIKASPAFPVPPSSVTNTEAIGAVLYTDYIYPFQVSGLILFIAMVGAISLTLRVRAGVRKQDIGKQVARKRSDGVEVVKICSGKGV